MTDNFLTEKERDCLINRAKLLKVTQRISETAESIRQLFGLKEGDFQNWTGIKIEIPVALDELTVERFDMAVPYLRRSLGEYHNLRETQKQLEKEIRSFSGADVFEVIIKK